MAKEKSQQLDIELQIRTAIKTGDVRIGAKQALKACANGDAKLLIFSNNCTPEVCQAASQHNVPQYTYNEEQARLQVDRLVGTVRIRDRNECDRSQHRPNYSIGSGQHPFHQILIPPGKILISIGRRFFFVRRWRRWRAPLRVHPLTDVV